MESDDEADTVAHRSQRLKGVATASPSCTHSRSSAGRNLFLTCPNATKSLGLHGSATGRRRLFPPPCYIHDDRGPWVAFHTVAAPSSLSYRATAPSTVGAMLRNLPQARRLLRRMGFEKEDAYFWKQMGKAMLCTYTLFGVAWLWNETSPLGWWTLKPRPKEEKEMAHLYERRKFPYPGDEEAVEEFIKSGGALGTTIGPKGFADANMDSENMQKQLQSKNFEQEAQKLWLRMRNEVIQELQEKGFDIE
ncbi:hypothetical protein C2845_PM03G29570 [Panicum miliaceum]|uniref:Homeobox prospero protein n=1 Tax=Panicum miliaceum TaxID=4540 RepID=A0A3L6TCW3_PANMI|nr:hypothetical protein C2845_PM03G29570 [Panicum miliaceum]